MIKNSWYAVLSSREIKNNKLLSAKRLGKNLVFFRGKDGELSCFMDKCLHRGAALSGGKIKENCIQCPFHGIEYDKDGKCVFIPSEGKSSEKDFSRFNLEKFPVKEVNDMIYLWYGDEEVIGEPDYFDEVSKEGYVYSELVDHWKVHYSRVIENQMDVSHLPFVHYNTIGRGNKTLVNGPKTIWIDENTLQTSANNEVDRGQTPLKSEESVIKSTNLKFKFPNSWLNTISEKIMVTAYFVPVDQENTLLYIRFYNRITPIKVLNKLISYIAKFANLKIERQDKKVVETQMPKESPLRMGEMLLSADKAIIEYRKRREKLKNNIEN